MTPVHDRALPPGDDADARFPTYPADVAARIDNPDDGGWYRAMLGDDPQTPHALPGLAGELSAARGQAPAQLQWTAVAALTAIAAALAVLAVRLRT